MLGAFVNAFRTPDLRKKLRFVIMIVAIFRFGSQLPSPGVDVGNVRDCVQQVSNSGVFSGQPRVEIGQRPEEYQVSRTSGSCSTLPEPQCWHFVGSGSAWERGTVTSWQSAQCQAGIWWPHHN